MAYLLTHFWPGASEEQYRATLAAVHPDGGRSLPAGQTYHAAAKVDGGIVIVAMWDSKDSADRFVSEVLMAAMPVQGGVEGQPEAREGEVVNEVSA